MLRTSSRPFTSCSFSSFSRALREQQQRVSSCEALAAKFRGVRFSIRSSIPEGMETKGAADEQARKAASMARLLARPLNPSEQQNYISQPRRGVVPLNLSGSRRDGLLYIPKNYSIETPAPVVVILHGAGGHAEGALQLIHDFADVHGLILIAPESRGRTWDMIIDRYGPDVEFINRCLTKVFHEYNVDPKHLCIAGFSDGASYSISLGVCNGFLFTHIIGFSPGFIRVQRYEDAPLIYVSHGIRDSVLHIGNCSRRLVPELLEHKYRVTYKEFDEGHTVPASIAEEALAWFMQTTDK